MRTPTIQPAHPSQLAGRLVVTALLVTGTACATQPSLPRADTSGAAQQSSVAQPPGAPCPPPGGPGTSGDVSEFGAVRLACVRSGPAVALNHLGGSRPVLVNLWASWCLPCQREMPRLQRAASVAGTRLLLLGVDTLDSTDSARSFLRAVRSTYPQVSDPDGVVRTAIHAVGLPATVVLRADGSVAFRKLGELTESDLITALRAVGVALTPDDLTQRRA